MALFIYTKFVDGVKKLFGNTTSNQPTTNDIELTYKDTDGDPYTPQPGTPFVDGGNHTIKDANTGEFVNVFIGETCVIGSVKTLSSITVESPMKKVAYKAGEKLNLAGLKLKLTYSDATFDVIPSTKITDYDITVSPAVTAALATTDTAAVFSKGQINASVAITVTAE